jgi:hypothetical protein
VFWPATVVAAPMMTTRTLSAVAAAEAIMVSCVVAAGRVRGVQDCWNWYPSFGKIVGY